MLFDPKWERNSLAGLIAWLEQQPPETEYNFMDCQGCLIARYMGEGFSVHWPQDIRDIYGGVDKGHIAKGAPLFAIVPTTQTYGAALERAKKVRSDQITELCAA